MLEALVSDGGRNSVAAIARNIGMPVSTAHRQVATLVQEAYLVSTHGGRHVPGPRLLGLLHRLDEKQVIANIAAPMLDRLAGETNCIVQLGTFENDMVTYRVKTGANAAGLFTRVGMQLEAYCSGIGKVLLAHLPQRDRDAYLACGPFIALTPQTIVDPAALDAELSRVRREGFAVDDGEITDELVCVAVPIYWTDGQVPAAISASQARNATSCVSNDHLVPTLIAIADRISAQAPRS
jgi:DNA-binding IclR family transcriptional regulator